MQNTSLADLHGCFLDFIDDRCCGDWDDGCFFNFFLFLASSISVFGFATFVLPPPPPPIIVLGFALSSSASFSLITFVERFRFCPDLDLITPAGEPPFIDVDLDGLLTLPFPLLLISLVTTISNDGGETFSWSQW